MVIPSAEDEEAQADLLDTPMETDMSLPTYINIERLTSGVTVWRKGGDFGPFGAAAEVVSCEFDADGFYTITALLIETDGADEWTGEDEVIFFVDAGEKIEFAGQGIPPFMRPEGDVTGTEWQAKIAANVAVVDRAIHAQNVAARDFRNFADALDGVSAVAAE